MTRICCVFAQETSASENLTYEEQFEVQCILARRCTSRASGTFEYLVGWEGYGVEGDTWEPEAHPGLVH